MPFLDTVVSGFALALPARHKVRGLSKKRLLRKAAAPLLPARDRARPQARLLDPGRGVAARRARAVRARDARGGRAPAAGLLPARAGARDCSTSTSPAREDWSRQLWGLLVVHALVRAPRRARGPRRSRERGCRRRCSREGLDRHDGERARARLPAADRDPARARRRGRDHRARLRADAAAARAARARGGRGDRAARRPLAHGQGARDGVAPARAAELGARPRLRRRARARLARADDDRAAARHPELDDVRLRVGVAAAPARLPRRDEASSCRTRSRPNGSRATARRRRSSSSTRG